MDLQCEIYDPKIEQSLRSPSGAMLVQLEVVNIVLVSYSNVLSKSYSLEIEADGCYPYLGILFLS